MDFQEFQFSPQKVKERPSNTISKQSAKTQSTLSSSNQQKIQSRKQQDNKNGDEDDLAKRIRVLNKILDWRSKNQAAVDTMGCERLADLTAPPLVQKFQTLVALILSVQTKDETTSMVVKRLQNYGLTPDNIAKMTPEDLYPLIRESNFHKRKSTQLIELARKVLIQGKLADNKKGLLAYAGVGVKIATIYLSIAEGKQQGIGVDTHVHRISNRLGWVIAETPQETQHQMQNSFPQKHWSGINIGLVGFGQLICKAIKPLCKNCPVAADCPSKLEF